MQKKPKTLSDLRAKTETILKLSLINCHGGNLLIDPDNDLRLYHPAVVSTVGRSERALDWKLFSRTRRG